MVFAPLASRKEGTPMKTARKLCSFLLLATAVGILAVGGRQ
jgi:hypothetical protein